MSDIRVLKGGFSFLECPRWHKGRLWVSEVYADRVFAVSESGTVESTMEVSGRPGGIGWLPDGSMLVVSTRQRRIVRATRRGLDIHADLSMTGAVGYELNDMVVDVDGRCYVGEYGVDVHAWMQLNRPRIAIEGVGILGSLDLPSASIFVIEPDGRIGQEVPELRFPNGSVIAANGKKLIVAETLGLRLSSFDLANGRLSGRRTSELGFTPDGISDPDVEGCIWAADPIGCTVRRVTPDGHTVETIANDRRVYACALGGTNGNSLFLCTSSTAIPREALDRRDAQIEVTTVCVGRPPSLD